jgi:transcriptional regulator with XRE-family HTH domain
MSAPIVDLHPDDTAARDELAQSLIAARHEARLSVPAVAGRLGVTPSAVNQRETCRGWRVSTVQQWARAVDQQLSITVAGIVIPDDGDDLAAAYAASEPVSAAAWDRLHLRMVVNDLVRVRRHLGVTQSGLAIRLGVTKPAVGIAETHPDGWQVASVQRYARALDGVARFGLVPVEAGQVAA